MITRDGIDCRVKSPHERHCRYRSSHHPAPIAWALAAIAGLALNWLVPLPFLPAALPARWVGGAVLVLALVLLAWAISTITQAGSNVPANRPATTIVESGPTALHAIPSTLA